MKQSKEKKLIEFFERKRRITSWEAIIKFRLTRLSDIIFRLRRKGYVIETERKGKENFAIYKLIKKTLIIDSVDELPERAIEGDLAYIKTTKLKSR